MNNNNEQIYFTNGTFRYIYLTDELEFVVNEIKKHSILFGYVIDPYVSITDDKLRVEFYIETRNKIECRAFMNDLKTSLTQFGKIELLNIKYGLTNKYKVKNFKNYSNKYKLL